MTKINMASDTPKPAEVPATPAVETPVVAPAVTAPAVEAPAKA